MRKTNPKPEGTLQLPKAGSLISYSAGTNQHNAEGFRVIQKNGSYLKKIIKMLPDLAASLSEQPVPVFINCYPAPPPEFPIGIIVETYLSQKITFRALKLAFQANSTVILAGQPLFLADIIVNFLKTGNTLPKNIILATGGYVMPFSLEQFIKNILKNHGNSAIFIHLYGVAEVDSSCLFALKRNSENKLLYQRRGEDVQIQIKNSQLILSLFDEGKKAIIEEFETRDEVIKQDGFYLISNKSRYSEFIENELESWSFDQWHSRTGYLGYSSNIKCQLRKDRDVHSNQDINYYDFMKEFQSGDWLSKPNWSWIP